MGWLNVKRSALACLLSLALLFAGSSLSLAYEQQIRTLASTVAENIALAGRNRIAVVDFTDLQGNVTELGRFVAEELSVALFGVARGFKVIDRIHVKALLQEHGLALTGLIDPTAASKLGQIAGVDAIVTGTVTPFGDSVRLSVKVLDSATAEILSASSGDIPKTQAIEELMAKGISPGAARSAGGAATVSGQGTQAQQQQQAQQQVQPSSTGLVRADVDGWAIELMGCKRSTGKQVLCTFTITNTLDDRDLRLVTSSASSSERAWDDRNTQCSMVYVRVANKGGTSSLTTFFISGVPTTVVYTIDGVTTGAAGIALLQILVGDKVVKFRDIPITQ